MTWCPPGSTTRCTAWCCCWPPPSSWPSPMSRPACAPYWLSPGCSTLSTSTRESGNDLGIRSRADLRKVYPSPPGLRKDYTTAPNRSLQYFLALKIEVCSCVNFSVVYNNTSRGLEAGSSQQFCLKRVVRL